MQNTFNGLDNSQVFVELLWFVLSEHLELYISQLSVCRSVWISLSFCPHMKHPSLIVELEQLVSFLIDWIAARDHHGQGADVDEEDSHATLWMLKLFINVRSLMTTQNGWFWKLSFERAATKRSVWWCIPTLIWARAVSLGLDMSSRCTSSAQETQPWDAGQQRWGGGGDCWSWVHCLVQVARYFPRALRSTVTAWSWKYFEQKYSLW